MATETFVSGLPHKINKLLNDVFHVDEFVLLAFCTSNYCYLHWKVQKVMNAATIFSCLHVVELKLQGLVF